MILTGKNIIAKDDPLMKIKPEYLYHKLINPDTEISANIRQLRIVKQLDYRQYSQLKRNLPYIVCGIFNPPVRRTENFAYTEYFIVDIDKVSEKEMSLEGLRQQLQTDTRVIMCFISPGEDGLKLMFKLKERCYDPGIYSVFYRMFVKQFSVQYNIEQVVDARTSDVARACFVSVDEHAYYNPNADVVDINAYINAEDTSELFRIQKSLNKELAEIEKEKKDEKIDVIKGPDDESLLRIKALLNPKLKALVEKKEAFVPEELNVVMERLIPYLFEAGINTFEVVNISYGKKLKMKVGFREAEVNLFFGKRGYTVVQSPRRGTNDELNTLCAELINQFLLE
ncbi:MAG: virulence protein E [Bacteroidales bacterium 36-12]|nr:MAG: virulence protein E [Bacteroidales bacterium 36-12]